MTTSRLTENHVLGGHVHLSITHLATFLAVVQYGSMTAAALALKYSLSTVSTHVTYLEKRLDSRLLLRYPGGCTPTSAGREVASQAVKLLDVHDKILGTVRSSTPHDARQAAVSNA